MDIFYRGYDPNARITSAAQHLSAAASRLALSMVRSIPHLPEATWKEFQRLLTIEALWALCLILAGWLIATIVGGLVGLAVNAVLIAYGLIELWEQLKAVGGTLAAWAQTAYEAQAEADLDRAGEHFASALSKGGIVLVEILVTHRVFRSVEGRLCERFPVPDWLKGQYEEAAARREPPKREPARSPSTEIAKRSVEVVASGSRYAGAKRVAEEFPTAAVLAGGAALALGAVATLVWATRTLR